MFSGDYTSTISYLFGSITHVLGLNFIECDERKFIAYNMYWSLI